MNMEDCPIHQDTPNPPYPWTCECPTPYTGGPSTLSVDEDDMINSVGGKTFTVRIDTPVGMDPHVVLNWVDHPLRFEGDALFTADDARVLGVALINAYWELKILESEIV